MSLDEFGTLPANHINWGIQIEAVPSDELHRSPASFIELIERFLGNSAT